MWKSPIKAVLVDIDGCLTAKSFGQSLDIESLKQLQAISRNSQHDPAIPLLILNTGRDLNFTELMAKIIDGFHYFIIEMGAAVVSVHGAQSTFKIAPEITSDALNQLDKLFKGFLKTHPEYYEYVQFGKRYMITFLFQEGDETRTQCIADLQEYLKEHKLKFTVDVGHNFINIMYPNVNKGTAMDLLFQLNPELNFDNIGGVGDSTGDWDFLKRCTFSACPANGSEFLKQHCHYASIYPETQGTLEIIHYIIKRNRFLLDQQKKFQKVPQYPIKFVICDINGTIDSVQYGKATDLEQIGQIRQLIQQAKKDRAIPRIILNTGWDLNYTALYAQLLNDFEYHIIERGAAVFSIKGPEILIKTDPRITTEIIDQITHLQTGFIMKYPQYKTFVQVGKKYMLSFQFEMGAYQKEECLNQLREYFKDGQQNYEIDDGPNYINVSVPGINKGTGAILLHEVIPDFNFQNTVGIGDSTGDWDYMKLCGFSACPSNANSFLRQRCDYVASKPESLGVLEILNQIIQWNLNMGEK